MSEDNPYRKQPGTAFWKATVSERHFLEIDTWYKARWPIADRRIAAAGSCFAQHIGRNLRRSGFRFLDVEPAPQALAAARRPEFGYELYSARYGNIYTARQLLQLLQRATGEFEPAERAWALGKGWVDPFRPTIEPVPYSSIDELEAMRQGHLAAVRRLFEQTDLFVFTLGLTETWMSRQDGAVFPLCPGTRGGSWDPGAYCFENLDYEAILADMESFLARARAIRPDMHFILTVSPVPLAATATSMPVHVATSYSKSVLRAVAGKLAAKYPWVDYFPSYEIIVSPMMRGTFFLADQRSVADAGVEHVMRQFFRQHTPPPDAKKPIADCPTADGDDIVCDEALLAAFGEAPP